jgi:hypothetical protein
VVVSDELLDRVDAWAMAETATERARAEELPLVRLMAAVRAAWWRRVAVRVVAGIMVIGAVAWVTAALMRGPAPAGGTGAAPAAEPRDPPPSVGR